MADWMIALILVVVLGLGAGGGLWLRRSFFADQRRHEATRAAARAGRAGGGWTFDPTPVPADPAADEWSLWRRSAQPVTNSDLLTGRIGDRRVRVWSRRLARVAWASPRSWRLVERALQREVVEVTARSAIPLISAGQVDLPDPARACCEQWLQQVAGLGAELFSDGHSVRLYRYCTVGTPEDEALVATALTVMEGLERGGRTG